MTEKMPENRTKSGQFRPGMSGNPGGRPKMPEEFRQLARENSIPALQVVVDILKNPKSANKDRLKAAEIILDRAWGKPIQGVEMSGPAGGPVEVKHYAQLDDDQLDQIILAKLASISKAGTVGTD
jgi:hypothetical protein